MKIRYIRVIDVALRKTDLAHHMWIIHRGRGCAPRHPVEARVTRCRTRAVVRHESTSAWEAWISGVLDDQWY